MIERFKPGPVTLAVVLALALAGWLASGAVNSFRDDEPAPAHSPAAPDLPRVETRWLEAEMHAPRLTVQGQIEAWQQVDVAARIAATVEALPVSVGLPVRAGEVLVRLSEDTRREQIARFEAEARLREREFAAVERLRGSNMQTETEALRLQSELARIRAELAAARMALRDTEPRAPFDAMLDRHLVEVGDFVQPGTPLLRLVAIDRLKVSAQVPQQEVLHLAEGQHAEVELLDGRRLSGRLVFIASAADAGTRSFRIEIEVANPDRLRVAGASATLRVHLEPVRAHRISPALLVLDADGRLGVRAVDGDERVVQFPVRLLGVSGETAWVAGLEERVRLVTRGGGFVEPGDRVVAVDAD